MKKSLNKSLKKSVKKPSGNKNVFALGFIIIIALITAAALYFFVVQRQKIKLEPVAPVAPVTLFSECSYQGTLTQLQPGVQESPIVISSMVVPQGYKVTLKDETTGRKLMLAGGNYPCLDLNFINLRGRSLNVTIELDE